MEPQYQKWPSLDGSQSGVRMRFVGKGEEEMRKQQEGKLR